MIPDDELKKLAKEWCLANGQYGYRLGDHDKLEKYIVDGPWIGGYRAAEARMAERVKELEEQNAYFIKSAKDSNEAHIRACERNAKLVAALEFYADPKHWETEHVCDSYSGAIGDLFTGVIKGNACFEEMGGLRARQALAENENV